MTTPEVILDVLVIFKSRASAEMISSIVSLLLDMLVSFSLLVTTTKLEITPFDITLQSIVKTAVDPLVKEPMYHTPSRTL